MKRTLTFWLFLAPAYLVATTGVSFVFFHHVDLRFDVWAALVVVPVVQAALLAWVTRSTGGGPLLPALLETLTRPPVAILLAVDATVLLAGWLFLEHPLVGLAEAGSLQPSWIALKAGLAGLLFGLAATTRFRAAEGKAAPFFLGVALLFWATEIVHPFTGRLLLSRFFGPLPHLARGAIVFGLLVAAAVGLALASGSRLAPRAPGAALALDGAVAAALGGVAILLLELYWRPVPPPLRASAIRTLASVSATLCLAAALGAWLPVRDGKAADGAA